MSIESRPYTGLVNGTKSSEWWNAIRPEFEALWASKLTTSQIGAELGVTKNAVIGKAGRWNLKSRAGLANGFKAGAQRNRSKNSGTRRGDAVKRAAKIAAEAANPKPAIVKPVKVVKVREAKPIPAQHAQEAVRTPQPIIPVITYPAEPYRRPAALPAPVAYSDFRTCQEVIGPPTGFGLDYRVSFCGDEAKPGRPYCEPHCQKNYTTNGRREPSRPFIPKLYAVGSGRRLIDGDAT